MGEVKHPSWCVGEDGRSTRLWDCAAMEAHRGDEVATFRVAYPVTIRSALWQPFDGEDGESTWDERAIRVSVINDETLGEAVAWDMTPDEADALAAFLVEQARTARWAFGMDDSCRRLQPRVVAS